MLAEFEFFGGKRRGSADDFVVEEEEEGFEEVRVADEGAEEFDQQVFREQVQVRVHALLVRKGGSNGGECSEIIW